MFDVKALKHVRFKVAPPPGSDQKQPPLKVRLAWFAGLWLVSVGAVACLAYFMRALLGL